MKVSVHWESSSPLINKHVPPDIQYSGISSLPKSNLWCIILNSWERIDLKLWGSFTLDRLIKGISFRLFTVFECAPTHNILFTIRKFYLFSNNCAAIIKKKRKDKPITWNVGSEHWKEHYTAWGRISAGRICHFLSELGRKNWGSMSWNQPVPWFK